MKRQFNFTFKNWYKWIVQAYIMLKLSAVNSKQNNSAVHIKIVYSAHILLSTGSGKF
jgi:hypothetical protein